MIDYKTLRVPEDAWETAKEQKEAAGRTWGEQIIRPDIGWPKQYQFEIEVDVKDEQGTIEASDRLAAACSAIQEHDSVRYVRSQSDAPNDFVSYVADSHKPGDTENSDNPHENHQQGGRNHE